MADFDVISLSSDSSRPSSPFINVSEVFNITEQNPNQSLVNQRSSFKKTSSSYDGPTGEIPSTSYCWPQKSSPLKSRGVHTLSDSEGSDTDEVSKNNNTFNELYQKYCQTSSSASAPCTQRNSPGKQDSQCSAFPDKFNEIEEKRVSIYLTNYKRNNYIQFY